jgi:Zn-dependent M28 family amino/carboxypeptidase
VKCWNLVGIVRGADPERREESVVFSAHLDHLGIGAPDESGDTVYNGARDNALGVAKVLGAAEALVRSQPRRSIVFAVVGAEERGLLGSWYYVRNAALPIDKAVANINLDGGREGVATEDVVDNGADFSDLAAIVREVMQARGIGVTADLAARDQVGFSSDHYAFLLAGVPAVDLKDGYSINGDTKVAVRERRYYTEHVSHKQNQNFDERTYSMESATEMAKRSVWLAWHLAQMDGMPQIQRDHAMWRERGRPEEPFYFGKGVGF